MTIKTDRLLMRPWRDADRDPLAALNAEPAVQRYLQPITRAGSDALFDRITAHFDRHGWGFWALEETASGQLIGLCGLATVAWETPVGPAVEIGWRLSTPWHGLGLAREAAEAALGVGFGEIGLDRIVAFTVPANRPSWGLMERLGMVHLQDFDHPMVPEASPLRRHRLYEIRRPSPAT